MGLPAPRRSKEVLCLVDTFKQLRSVRDKEWKTMSTLGLLAVLPGVLSFLLLGIFLQYAKSRDDTTRPASELPGLYAHLGPGSDMARPSSPVPEPLTTPAPATNERFSPSHYLRPQRSLREGVCSNTLCRFVAQWLRSKIDNFKDPCKDFYGYVCATHRGHSQLRQIAATLHLQNQQFLMQQKVPRTHQLSWQKAAGLLQTCISFVKSNRTETADLATWMRSWNLDLNDEGRLAIIEPFDMIVRCSLDLGVPAILSLELHNHEFFMKKRVMKLDFSQKEKEWLNERLRRSDSYNRNDYAKLLSWYGVQRRRDAQIAAKLVGYEKEVRSIIRRHPEKEPRFVAIDYIPLKFTRPYITKDQWVNAFSKYTNNTYTAVDPILFQEAAVKVIVDMLKSMSLGENGLRYLIAWSVYTQLVKYTVPNLLLDGNPAAAVCYVHTIKVMKLALTSPFLQKVAPDMLQAVKTMVSNVRKAFRSILESSWVTGHDRSTVLRKLDNMKTFVGSPGRRLEPEFVEELYKSYPNVPPDRLFPTWIKALSLSTHYLWSDQTTWLYDETEVNARYETNLNTIVIPTAIVAHPLFNYRAPEALNYGALGSIIGHEMMHAYDVAGIEYDENAKWSNWRSPAFKREYTKRALCLRRSHRAAARFIRSRLLSDEESSDKQSERDGYTSTRTYFCLLTVIPLTLCILCATLYITYSWPTDQGNITLLNKSTELHTATPCTPDQIHSTTTPLAPAQPVTKHSRMRQSRAAFLRVQSPNVCSSQTCHFVAQWLRAKLHPHASPCDDFFHYVCHSFKETNQYHQTNRNIAFATARLAVNLVIPRTGQTYFQKAAAMIQACVNFVRKGKLEAYHVQQWMISLGLDLFNIKQMEKLNPIDLVVRLSLEQGFPALLDIVVEFTEIPVEKRLAKMKYNKNLQKRLERDAKWQALTRQSHYTRFAHRWGASGFSLDTANDIVKYDDILLSIQRREMNEQTRYTIYEDFDYLGNKTSKYATSAKWRSLFAKYTNNNYNSEGSLLIEGPALTIFAAMLDTPGMGQAGVNNILFWNVFLQMLNYADPAWINQGYEIPTEACYYHVARVLKEALVTPYLQTLLPPEAIEEARTMAYTIRDAFEASMRSSSWFIEPVLSYAIKKLKNITFLIGTPEYVNLTEESMEEYYKDLPDTDVEHLFPSWTRAMAFTARQMWVVKKSVDFDWGQANAEYYRGTNSIGLQAGLFTRPTFYPGLDPLNYGASGGTAGHEIMHAFDVLGIMTDMGGKTKHWTTQKFLKEYTLRTLCVRRAHQVAAGPTARKDVIDDTKDSENMADFVGVMTSYRAFRLLPEPRWSRRLPGLNLTADQLFFINRAILRCGNERGPPPFARYASYRARCNVPLMNMVEFSSAFNCKPGDYMNPPKKCTFWD